MNPLRFLVCWWYNRHLPVTVTRLNRLKRFYTVQICARCGKKL
jgi:hypothetical protein